MGWETDIRQLDLNARPVHFAACAGDKLTLLEVQFPNRAHQLTAPPRDRLTFGIPKAPQCPVNIRNTPVSSESITYFADGVESVSEEMFSAFTVSIDVVHMQSSIQHLDSASSFQLAAESRKVDTVELTKVRRVLSAAIELAGLESLGRATRAALFRNFEAQLPDMITRMWSAGETEGPGPSGHRRRDVIRRSIKRLAGEPAGQCRIEDLCQAGACSQRTLERSYREHFGITPKQYLNRYRLAGVHKALLNAEETRSIGDLAADWGFWHLSQFATNYRAMYGERPSETARRARA